MQKKIHVLAMIILFSTQLSAQDDFDFDKQWRIVEKFEIENLPKSALAEVNKIYEAAVKAKEPTQRVKALMYQAKIALMVEEDAQYKVILTLKKEIATASFPTSNILESVIADLYWQYFQRNRWKFYNRTETTEKVDSVDFRTWDLQTIFKETHRHFQNSLTNALELQDTDLAQFYLLLEQSKDSRLFRPTLYDFLAHRALDFYYNDESYLKRPSYKFEIDDPNLLGTNTDFVRSTLNTKDSLSQRLHALKLYKNLSLFHLNDKNPRALIDVTIARLDFVRTHAIVDQKDSMYLKTLEALSEQYKKQEVGTEIDYVLAYFINEQGGLYAKGQQEEHRWKLLEAIKIAEAAIERFPTTRGAQKCRSLIQQIKAPSLTMITEKYVPVERYSRTLVTYKNEQQLYFNAFKLSENEFKQFNELRRDSTRIAFIKKLKVIASWSQTLKDENDYQSHQTEIKIPPLPAGRIMIYGGTLENFNEEDTFAYSFIQVTDLVLIENIVGAHYQYQVVDRITGKPRSGAKVNIKNYNTGRYNHPIDRTLTTDKQGFVAFTVDDNYSNVQVSVRYDRDRAYFGNNYLSTQRKQISSDENRSSIFLFSDRSIYRPGQKFYFKGIAVSSKSNEGHALVNKNVQVNLQDVNGQIVKTIELKSNEYGSFSGEFILPATGLTGNFYLRAILGTTQGGLSFSVEEYKRPKFEASFEPVEGVVKLNDTVKVQGSATAFAGSMITDAKVTYRVVRNASFPSWYWYRRPYHQVESLEITKGETTTDGAGKFEIKFKAIPDPSIKKESQPTFSYQVYADITDLNGETRSTQTYVNVGYHTLNLSGQLTLQWNRQDTDQTIVINSSNLNGQFVGTKGQLKIYKLKSPGRVLRNRVWPAPDNQEISREKFIEMYPHEAYENENNTQEWELGKLMFSTDFDTEKSKEVLVKNYKKWALGAYIVKLTAEDDWKQPVKSDQYFSVFDPQAKKVADAQFFEIKMDKSSYEPGQKVKISLGSAAKELYVTVRIEKKYKTVKTEVIKLSNDIKSFEIPINEEDIGGFSVHYQLAGLNDYRSGTLAVQVPYPPHYLTVESSTFRDKLQPGQKETWSFKISGPNKDKVSAEILASMYDASLDQFRGHNWSFNPIYQNYYYSYNRSQAHHSFGTEHFNVHQRDYEYVSFPYQGYDRLKWFGLDFNNPSWIQRQYVDNLRRERTSFDRIISGVVTDESGPLPGVSVIIKGTSYGTETDFDGNYSLKIKEGDELVFSYVGMKSKTVKIGTKNEINQNLEVANVLDEVVVTAMGISRRKQSLGYSTQPALLESRVESEMVAEEMSMDDSNSGGQFGNEDRDKKEAAPPAQTAPGKPTVDLKGVIARKNLEETAFFYPHLETDAEGNVSFSFTAPESLTKWNINLLAHTKDMAVGRLSLSAVTQKELMVMPNPPRFFREGDRITFSAKIANLTDKELNGHTELQLFDALTNAPIDVKLGNDTKQQTFSVDAKGNTSVSWDLNIADGVQAVKYRVVAKADEFSDGEENALPVLSNRMLVTETLPMWVRSNQTKTFSLDKLQHNKSTTLKNHKLTLEVTSNPAWYAIQALPYLMEYPFECAEQTFSRYYSNSLASHIANVNPRIKEVFDQWANSDALLSNLEKNQELKSLIIQETPWLRDAQSETEQKKRIALLFDMNKMESELNSAIRKLGQMQFSNGGFPWFKGARYPNRYITQHIASGFGHLKKLGVNPAGPDLTMVLKAVDFLDDEIESDYKSLLKEADRIRRKAKTKTEGERAAKAYMAADHIGNFQVQYLYMRSFYTEKALPKSAEAAVEYYTNQGYTYWKDKRLYTKGMIALIAHRNGHASATAITRSLKENAVVNEELGMYWKNNTGGWYWYEAKIETQALMIEVFSEVTEDQSTVDELKVWLLKNKQTNRWSSTKSTTEAVYALLLQGSDWLEVTDFLDIKIGDKTIDPLKLQDSKVEAGTGYFKTSWTSDEITPEMATVTLKKDTKGVAWGGLYWQYFEDLDKITPAKTPLSLSKKLFLKENTDRGEVLTAIDKVTLKLGDLVRVRIELKVDRDMEFIHMKDMRAAGFEPVNVISRYKWQDGLGYYESTKDAATNFFMDNLPKGVYVFEYDLRVNNKGEFSNGITTIQSMYAPEFSSHSEGVRVTVE